jgi:hypothetical protein
MLTRASFIHSDNVFRVITNAHGHKPDTRPLNAALSTVLGRHVASTTQVTIKLSTMLCEIVFEVPTSHNCCSALDFLWLAVQL